VNDSDLGCLDAAGACWIIGFALLSLLATIITLSLIKRGPSTHGPSLSPGPPASIKMEKKEEELL
jgi:hypothetical protein